jgi:hypothetical protein
MIIMNKIKLLFMRYLVFTGVRCKQNYYLSFFYFSIFAVEINQMT